MTLVKSLRCTVTGKHFEPDSLTYTNPEIGDVATLDIMLEYEYLSQTLDRDKLQSSSDYSMWRYRDLLPLQIESIVPPLRVGFTPLYHTPRLAEALGLKQVWLKDDGQNPTGSFKDRASAMVIAHAVEKGLDTITTASTGNAAAALAGLGAAANIRSIIFVPSTAPQAKIAQLLVYGATVLLIEDSYDVAFDLCLETSIQQNWYCRNTGINPYTTEGKKTAAFEIAEQLHWEVPDVVVVSVGDGSIIGGLYKGFYDLLQIGWIDHIPRLIGVQSEGSNPLVKAWEDDDAAVDMKPVSAHSIADSIVAGLPRDRVKALRAVRETNGAMIAVPDAMILGAIPMLAQNTGVFAEPAAAAALAGTQRAVETGVIHDNEKVVIISTGSGLKDIAHAQQSVHIGIHVQPTLEAVKQALHSLEPSLNLK